MFDGNPNGAMSAFVRLPGLPAPRYRSRPNPYPTWHVQSESDLKIANEGEGGKASGSTTSTSEGAATVTQAAGGSYVSKGRDPIVNVVSQGQVREGPVRESSRGEKLLEARYFSPKYGLLGHQFPHNCLAPSQALKPTKITSKSEFNATASP